MGQVTSIGYERSARTVRLSCAETAKLVRAALKAAFPGQTFSVTSKTYSGGASIDVRWVDGPTDGEVNAVTAHFAGATFDGRIDLKEHKPAVKLNGKLVSFGADYVQTHRDMSADFLRECAEAIADKYGVPAPEVREETWTHKGKTVESAWIERGGPNLTPGFGYNTAGDRALQLAYTTSKYERPIRE